MHDLETTTRIPDPNLDPRDHHPHNGTISVRILFTVGSSHLDFEDIKVYGVFRQADDSEIDYDSLNQLDKETIETACEKAFRSLTDK